MKCSGKCGKNLEEEKGVVYQVRVGHLEKVECLVPNSDNTKFVDEFIPHEDVGYYCSECLIKGV